MYLSVKEAAANLGCSDDTMRRLVRREFKLNPQGLIPIMRRGGANVTWRISEQAVDRIVKRLQDNLS